MEASLSQYYTVAFKTNSDLLNKYNIEFLSLKYSGVCTHILKVSMILG